MRFNFVQVLSVIAIFQSFFVSFHFSRLKKGFKPLNVILSLFLACFAILMMVALTQTIGIAIFFVKYHKLIFMIRQMALLVGPLLLYFILFSVNPNYQFQLRDFLHLFPFVISIIYHGIELQTLSFFIIWYSKLRLPSNIMILLHLLAYVIISIYLIWKRSIFEKSKKARLHHSKKNWILIIICGTITIWFVELSSLIILEILGYIGFCPYMASLYTAVTFIFFNYIVYFVLKKPELFNSGKKYEKSRLNSFQKRNIKNKLLKYFKEEKPYLESSLTLAELGENLSIPHRDLSQIINEAFQQNFYDFVNSYRIEESKKLLKYPANRNKTILEICYDAGFNSKSVFNSAFKKNTGLTPSEYRTSH